MKVCPCGTHAVSLHRWYDSVSVSVCHIKRFPPTLFQALGTQRALPCPRGLYVQAACVSCGGALCTCKGECDLLATVEVGVGVLSPLPHCLCL